MAWQAAMGKKVVAEGTYILNKIISRVTSIKNHDLLYGRIDIRKKQSIIASSGNPMIMTIVSSHRRW